MENLQDELSKTEQQEIETIKSIQKNIQSLRDLFSKLLSDREEELLKQCHAIYQHRRARIQSLINDVLVNKTNSEEEVPILIVMILILAEFWELWLENSKKGEVFLQPRSVFMLLMLKDVSL